VKPFCNLITFLDFQNEQYIWHQFDFTFLVKLSRTKSTSFNVTLLTNLNYSPTAIGIILLWILESECSLICTKSLTRWEVVESHWLAGNLHSLRLPLSGEQRDSPTLVNYSMSKWNMQIWLVWTSQCSCTHYIHSTLSNCCNCHYWHWFVFA